MLLNQSLAFTMHGKIQKSRTKIINEGNEEFQLPDESYSVSDIQNYFEYILKKHETVTNNPSIMIYVNKIENSLKQ